MGLMRMIFGAILVWFVWRLLDGFIGGRKPHASPKNRTPPNPKSRPDDSQVGEYVEYEEIEDDSNPSI
jgi:hypothetical protein